MGKYKVVITDYVYEHIELERREIARLGAVLADYQCRTEEEVIGAARDADAVIVQFAPVTRRVIENLERCKVIVRYAIGVDNIDVAAAAERGIVVCNVPDYGVDEVSNHAVLLLLACSRKLVQVVAGTRRGVWDYTVAKPVYRLAGQTLGLIGLGRIPSLVATKMAGFGLNIIVYDPYADSERAKELGVERVDLETLLKTSDLISVHCPLNDFTRRMFGIEQFRMMKKTAFFVNTARGGVVAEPDLVQALREGEIAGAAIDVAEKEPMAPDNPLLAMDNVIVTPHLAWYSVEAIASLQQKAAAEVVRVLSGKAPLNPVNAPK
jgi:D-3-phosphoglycerate dehydrogenase